MEILHFEDTSVVMECSLGVNLIIVIFVCSFGFFTSIYNLKAIGPLLMEILQFEDLGDISVNSKEVQGDIYLHIKFERDRLIIFIVRVLTSSRRTRRTRRRC